MGQLRRICLLAGHAAGWLVRGCSTCWEPASMPRCLVIAGRWGLLALQSAMCLLVLTVRVMLTVYVGAVGACPWARHIVICCHAPLRLQAPPQARHHHHQHQELEEEVEVDVRHGQRQQAGQRGQAQQHMQQEGQRGQAQQHVQQEGQRGQAQQHVQQEGQRGQAEQAWQQLQQQLLQQQQQAQQAGMGEEQEWWQQQLAEHLGLPQLLQRQQQPFTPRPAAQQRWRSQLMQLLRAAQQLAVSHCPSGSPELRDPGSPAASQWWLPGAKRSVPASAAAGRRLALPRSAAAAQLLLDMPVEYKPMPWLM